MKTPKPTPKPHETTGDFKLRIRQIVTGQKPYYVNATSRNVGRQIDSMTPEQIEILKLKGML